MEGVTCEEKEDAEGERSKIKFGKKMNGRKEWRKSQRESDTDGERREGEKLWEVRKDRERGSVSEEGTDNFVLTSKVWAVKVWTSERRHEGRGGEKQLAEGDAWENPEEPPGRLPVMAGEFLHPTARCHGNATHTLAASGVWRLDVSLGSLEDVEERLVRLCLLCFRLTEVVWPSQQLQPPETVTLRLLRWLYLSEYHHYF